MIGQTSTGRAGQMALKSWARRASAESLLRVEESQSTESAERLNAKAWLDTSDGAGASNDEADPFEEFPGSRGVAGGKLHGEGSKGAVSRLHGSSFKKRQYRQKTSEPRMTALRTVAWAISWMKKHYYRDFWVCVLISTLHAGLSASLPLIYDALFSNVLPRCTHIYTHTCMCSSAMCSPQCTTGHDCTAQPSLTLPPYPLPQPWAGTPPAMTASSTSHFLREASLCSRLPSYGCSTRQEAHHTSCTHSHTCACMQCAS